MKKCVFFNAKGGTGKTTICFNYGCYLAEKKNQRVLMMDFDPQANLAHAFNKDTQNELGKNFDSMIVDYIKGEDILFNKYIISINDKIDLLPSSNNISILEEYLTNFILKKSIKESKIYNANFRNQVILEILKKSINESDYDYLLIDSQANFSLLSSTALVYTKNIIVVLRPDLFSLLDFEYLKKIIKNLNAKFSIKIKIAGSVINAVEANIKSTEKITRRILNRYSKSFHIYEQQIKHRAAYQNSINLKKRPVFNAYPGTEASSSIIKLFSQMDDSLK